MIARSPPSALADSNLDPVASVSHPTQTTGLGSGQVGAWNHVLLGPFFSGLPLPPKRLLLIVKAVKYLHIYFI